VIIARRDALGQADDTIVLFTDFGLDGPYTGQMKAVLHQMAPSVPAIDLFADAPVGNPKASAYLLAVYAEWFPVGTVFLCVAGRPLFSRPTADGMSALATACSSSSSAVPERRAAAAGTSSGSRTGSQPAFTDATSSHRLQPPWRVANRRLAGRTRMGRIAGRTGRMSFARSFTSIISAMP
jgi:hypothetical protein